MSHVAGPPVSCPWNPPVLSAQLMPDRAFLSSNTFLSAFQAQGELSTALKVLPLTLVTPKGDHRVHRARVVERAGVTWVAASVPAAAAATTHLDVCQFVQCMHLCATSLSAATNGQGMHLWGMWV